MQHITLAQESGVPLLRNYSPEEYNSEPQIWAITQDQRGIMYFGASDGILEYDGSIWRKIYTPKKQVVRSLDIGSNGRVYVGSNNEFGYLKPDASGNVQYISLSVFLDTVYKNFGDVWKTVVRGNSVYFSSNNFIFKFTPEQEKPSKENIKTYKSETGFFLLFKNKTDVFSFQRRKGMYKIGKDSLELIKGATKVRTWFMDTYEGYKSLIGTNPDGLFVYDPNALKDEDIVTKKYFNKEAVAETESFLNENQLYHAIRLRDGRFALATIRSGIVIIDKFGKTLQHICKENGLQSQTVHYLFEDRQGALWAALTYGISKIETHYPVGIWDEKTGLVGSIYNVIRVNGKIYASSNLGLHYLDKNKFYPIEELAGKNAIQVFDLKKYKIAGKDKFLASSTHGIWEINGKNAQNISRFVTFGMYQSPIDSNCIYIPKDNEIYSLMYKERKWIESKSLVTFSNSPGSIAQLNDKELWCLVDNKPVLLKIQNSTLFPFYFNEKDYPEIKNVIFNSISIQDKTLYFFTEKGIFVYDVSQNKFLLDRSLFKGLFSGKNYDFVDVFKFEKIYFTVVKKNKRLHLISLKEENNKWSVDSASLKRLRDIELYYNDGDSLLWFVSSKTLYKYNPFKNILLSEHLYSLIRQVTIGGDSILFNGTYIEEKNGIHAPGFLQNSERFPVINFGKNDLFFYFSAPSFDNEAFNEFSYFLEGNSKQEKWSLWSKENKKEFTNLYEGTYLFKVKARNIYGIETNLSSFKFKILAPWYRTIWAYILYILLSGLFIWIMIKLNVRRLEQAKKRLEQIVTERTAEIVEQKEEILQQKEEILVQAEQLEASNRELEKLSLVACEADNAVMILDAFGNIEWVNLGFTRLYGFTTENLIEKRGNNITQNSSYPFIHEMLQQIKDQKKSNSYESLCMTISGEKIWVQTTLTPIYNKEGKLVKIVAIDSNISKLKFAEEEIRQQKEEIKSQRDEIESQRNLALAQRDEMSKQKKELTDSIRYALQIQKSMLPSDSLVKNLIKEYFVFYKPRDIVSGDFYWVNEVEEKVIITVGDCTGHGVPGAFMSLLGITFLKEIIVKEYITHPAVILNKLRKEVIRSMKQHGEGTELKDGMDISLCVYDKKTKTLEFAGANNSALIVRNKEYIELKSDRMPIGIYESMQKFTMKEFTLNENDIVYLYTDGFQDQFGGTNGKKFLSRKFKNLIIETSQLPLHKQEAFLSLKLLEWKDQHEQVDDITVLGVRFF